jgi:hypothetical protein
MRGTPTVLMMGEGMRKASHLEDFLKRSGWNCRVEPETSIAMRLAGENPYDVVLSGVRMDRAHRSKLVSSLTEAKASLFFSMAVEYGCWWLPAVRLGENCADSPALSPKRFAEEIERLRLQLLLDGEAVPSTGASMTVPIPVAPAGGSLPVTAPPRAVAAAAATRGADLKRLSADKLIAEVFRLTA